jgi:hypothetical protein
MWWLLFVSPIVGYLDSRLCHLGDHSWSRGKTIEQWAISGYFQMIIWVFPLWLLFVSPIIDYLSGSLVIAKKLSSEQYQGTFKWLFKYLNSNLHVFIDLHVLIYQKSPQLFVVSWRTYCIRWRTWVIVNFLVYLLHKNLSSLWKMLFLGWLCWLLTEALLRHWLRLLAKATSWELRFSVSHYHDL